MPSGVRGWLARITRYRRRLIPSPVRAAWYHAAALLREFRLPIFGFLLLTVVGGFAYGELYQVLRGDEVLLIDRPYVFVQLMTIEASDAVPPRGGSRGVLVRHARGLRAAGHVGCRRLRRFCFSIVTSRETLGRRPWPVAETSFLVGRTVGDLQTDQELDIVLVERTGEVSVQPSRDLTVQAGDDLVFFARHDRVLDVVPRNVAWATG